MNLFPCFTHNFERYDLFIFGLVDMLSHSFFIHEATERQKMTISCLDRPKKKTVKTTILLGLNLPTSYKQQ